MKACLCVEKKLEEAVRCVKISVDFPAVQRSALWLTRVEDEQTAWYLGIHAATLQGVMRCTENGEEAAARACLGLLCRVMSSPRMCDPQLLVEPVWLAIIVRAGQVFTERSDTAVFVSCAMLHCVQNYSRGLFDVAMDAAVIRTFLRHGAHDADVARFSVAALACFVKYADFSPEQVTRTVFEQLLLTLRVFGATCLDITACVCETFVLLCMTCPDTAPPALREMRVDQIGPDYCRRHLLFDLADDLHVHVSGKSRLVLYGELLWGWLTRGPTHVRTHVD